MYFFLSFFFLTLTRVVFFSLVEHKTTLSVRFWVRKVHTVAASIINSNNSGNQSLTNVLQFDNFLYFSALKAIPHQNKTVHGIEGENVSLSCSLTKAGVIGNLTWIYNGDVLNNKLTDTINVSVSLSKEYHKQTIRCRGFLQVINASLEEILTFNIACK